MSFCAQVDPTSLHERMNLVQEACNLMNGILSGFVSKKDVQWIQKCMRNPNVGQFSFVNPYSGVVGLASYVANIKQIEHRAIINGMQGDERLNTYTYTTTYSEDLLIMGGNGTGFHTKKEDGVIEVFDGHLEQFLHNKDDKKYITLTYKRDLNGIVWSYVGDELCIGTFIHPGAFNCHGYRVLKDPNGGTTEIKRIGFSTPSWTNDIGHPLSSNDLEDYFRIPQAVPLSLSLQNSFCSLDSLSLMKFRDIIDKKLVGWEFKDLLDPGVADSTWFDKWSVQLRAADGVLVLFTANYKSRINFEQNTPLTKEAVAIANRRAVDSKFKVFVMDPGEEGQGPNDLRCLLLDEKTELNFGGWKKFMLQQIDQEMNASVGLNLGSYRQWFVQ